MTDIAQYRKTANRVLVGPGTSQRLTASLIPAILFERYFDLATWDTQIFKGGEADPDSSVTMVNCSGVGTEVAALDATNKGWLLQTSAADNDNSFLHPHETGNKMGVAAYFNSNLQPYCLAQVLCGPADAQQLVEAEYVVGLDVMDTYTTKDASASGEADAARWQVTNGAAAGVATNWKTETSTGAGVDTIFDSGRLSQRATFVELAVFVSKARKPYYFYDGKLIRIGPSLDANIVMAPSIGVQVNNAGADDAKGMVVRYAAWGQRYAA